MTPVEASFEEARSKVSHTFRNRRLPTYGKQSGGKTEKRQRDFSRQIDVAKVSRSGQAEQVQAAASWLPVCLTGETRSTAVGGAWLDSSKRPRMI